ncbi:MAG: glycosyltransferase family 2 protein [Actinomycetota bacterium]|nr:glycosyltransferase family 2 protein [Actinomycetota bacterium]
MLIVVVPFLNEKHYLPTLLGSIENQTRLPECLLLVDDGSTDDSPRIASAFATKHPYAVVVQRPVRLPERDPLSAAHELRAFQWAVDQVDEPWEVVAKLDADLQLQPELFAEVERQFALDPALGIAGGYLSTLAPDERPVRHRGGPEHVDGASKFYRRRCFEEISPLPAILGWDTIDEVRARLRGWRTSSFELHSGGDSIHLRRMGSRDGVLRGFRRAGLAAYAYGAHPLYVLLSAAVRLRQRPLLLCGINYLLGWILAVARRAPRSEPDARAFLRDEQLTRMRRILRPRAGS